MSVADIDFEAAEVPQAADDRLVGRHVDRRALLLAGDPYIGRLDQLGQRREHCLGLVGRDERARRLTAAGHRNQPLGPLGTELLDLHGRYAAKAVVKGHGNPLGLGLGLGLRRGRNLNQGEGVRRHLDHRSRLGGDEGALVDPHALGVVGGVGRLEAVAGEAADREVAPREVLPLHGEAHGGALVQPQVNEGQVDGTVLGRRGKGLVLGDPV